MFTVYKTINIKNGRYYIGVHKTDKANDSYLGSGLAVKRAIKYYGCESFIKEILYTYDDENLAYCKERELVSVALSDPLCYNLMEGGEGGFSHINQNRHLFMNPMKNSKIAYKNLENRRRGDQLFPERIFKRSENGRNNIKKAILYNTGRHRPRQSLLMKEKGYLQQRWNQDKELMRDRLSTWFCLVSPTQETFHTNRLRDFCIERNLTYVSVWNTSRTGKCVAKGASKGWLCYVLKNE
jgi:hypothetical protein